MSKESCRELTMEGRKGKGGGYEGNWSTKRRTEMNEEKGRANSVNGWGGGG